MLCLTPQYTVDPQHSHRKQSITRLSKYSSSKISFPIPHRPKKKRRKKESSFLNAACCEFLWRWRIRVVGETTSRPRVTGHAKNRTLPLFAETDSFSDGDSHEIYQRSTASKQNKGRIYDTKNRIYIKTTTVHLERLTLSTRQNVIGPTR